MKTVYIRKPGHPLLHLILGAAGCLSLIVLLILLWVSSRISRPLLHQQGAERWQGTGAQQYEQVSVFRSVADCLDANTIENADQTIQTKLEEAGIPEASYLVCYGSEMNAAVRSDNGSSNAVMTLVGGDFFRLHGFQFLTGAGFLPDDVMQDRVVLDELAAWQLFSSNDCVGMQVTIQGDVFYVAGVVAPETDSCTGECYGEKARIYASYPYWNRSSENPPTEESAQADTSSSTPVTFCEAVLPEPVDDFAIATLAAAISVDQDEIRSNTERYSLEALWDNLRTLHMQGILSNAVVYPYWESAAMLAANQRSVLLVPIFIFLLLPLGWAVYGLIWLWRLVKAGGHGVVSVADRVVERRRTKQYLKTMAQKRRRTERTDKDVDENEDDQPMDTDTLSVVGSTDDGYDADGLRR